MGSDPQRPMPGQNEFSAEEEQAMRASARVAPKRSDDLNTRYMAALMPGQVPPDDATDEQ